MPEREGPLVIPLPEPVDRKARLGPFLSGRDALKFAGISAVGAVVADATTPVAWLPFLGIGLLLGTVRIDGKGPDAHVVDYVRWRARQHPPPRRRRSGGAQLPTGAIVRLPGGRCAAAVRSRGRPVAFLPTGDARGLFEAFTTLIRTQGHGLLFGADVTPVDGRPLLPPKGPVGTEEEGAARRGYRELVDVLAQHCRTRAVTVVTWSDPEETEGLLRLEERVQALTGSLLALGVTAERLEGAALGGAVAGLGGPGRRR
jgi:hypothetical protein